jgi:5-methylcytosine-specific restriction endonuclease McrA
MKRCIKCGEEKILTAFYFRTDSGKYRNICSCCYQKRKTEIRDYSKERIRCSLKQKTESGKTNCGLQNARRRAARELALVELDWAQLLTIKTLYMTASKMGLHVDHIRPLAKGGKHEPSNLQLLTPEENLKKGAKYEEPS